MKELVEAINGQKVTAEMFGEMKQIAATSMQKLLTGEALTAEEVQISGYVTKIMQQTVAKANKQAEQAAKANKQAEQAAKANKQAEQAAKAAQMEAETARLKQEWEIAMQTALLENVSKVFTPKAIALVKTIADVKALFATVLESLPKEPKAGKSTTSKKSLIHGVVKTIKEGTTGYAIQSIMKGKKDGMTKKELVEKLIVACPDKTKGTLIQTIDNGVAGRLPLVYIEDKLVWKETK